MAFNLDKNDGVKSSTKFDLSKTNTPATTDNTEGKRRSNTWLFVLPVLLAAGIASWYLLSKSSPENKNDIAEADVTTTNSNKANLTVGEQKKITTSTGDTLIDATTDNAVAKPVNNANASSGLSFSGFNNKVPATFSKGSNSISELDRSLVNEIIRFLEKNPTAVITVNGYASSEGELSFNQHISQLRADAFKSYLVSKGIDASRVNANGKGIDNPVSSNDTEDGRIKNRRVEILFQ